MAEDESFIISSSSTEHSVTNQMGNDVEIDVTSDSEMIYKVISHSQQNGIKLEMKYKKISQSMDGSMGTVSTDYGELIDRKVRFQLSQAGVISGHEGFENLPEIATSSGMTLNEVMYKLRVRSLFHKLPGKPVSIGDTWVDKQQDIIPFAKGSILSETTSTYTAVEAVKKDGYDCLKFALHGDQVLLGDFEQNGTPLSLERKTIISGTVYFAFNKGMLLHSEIKSEGKGMITVTGADMEIPQEITRKESMTTYFKE